MECGGDRCRGLDCGRDAKPAQVPPSAQASDGKRKDANQPETVNPRKERSDRQARRCLLRNRCEPWSSGTREVNCDGGAKVFGGGSDGRGCRAGAHFPCEGGYRHAKHEKKRGECDKVASLAGAPANDRIDQTPGAGDGSSLPAEMD